MGALILSPHWQGLAEGRGELSINRWLLVQPPTQMRQEAVPRELGCGTPPCARKRLWRNGVVLSTSQVLSGGTLELEEFGALQLFRFLLAAPPHCSWDILSGISVFPSLKQGWFSKG